MHLIKPAPTCPEGSKVPGRGLPSFQVGEPRGTLTVERSLPSPRELGGPGAPVLGTPRPSLGLRGLSVWYLLFQGSCRGRARAQLLGLQPVVRGPHRPVELDEQHGRWVPRARGGRAQVRPRPWVPGVGSRGLDNVTRRPGIGEAPAYSGPSQLISLQRGGTWSQASGRWFSLDEASGEGAGASGRGCRGLAPGNVPTAPRELPTRACEKQPRV